MSKLTTITLADLPDLVAGARVAQTDAVSKFIDEIFAPEKIVDESPETEHITPEP